MRRVNILYIIWSLDLGGAERVVINLVKGLDKRRFNPVVCCLNWKGEFAQEVEKEGIKVIALHKKPKLDISVIKKLITVIKNNNIDIVHTHLWTSNFFGRIAAILCGVPVIIASEHGISEKRAKWRFFADRILSIFSDRITLVSKNVREEFAKKVAYNQNKLRVIYNGVDIGRSQGHPSASLRTPFGRKVTKSQVTESSFGFAQDSLRPQGHRMRDTRSQVREELGIEKEEFVLSCIGRLSPEKGHRYLFEAMSLLNGRYRFKLLVVGDGLLLPNYKLQITNYKLENKIIFAGLRKDIPQILAISDLVIIPSLREAHSLAALEAMAAGVPIVATDVGGMNEIVIDGETGFLVPAKDSRALMSKIIELWESKSARKQMGERARERVRKLFNVTAMIEETQNLYQEVLREKCPRKQS